MELLIPFIIFLPFKTLLAVLLGSPWALYVFYRMVMKIMRNHPDNKYVWHEYLWVVPIVVIGYLLDIAVNYVVATVWFLELPLSWKEEKTVSERLSRYKLTDCGWRSKYSAWIGPMLLDKWDPKGIHIGYIKPTE